MGEEDEEGRAGEGGEDKAFQEAYLEENPEIAQKIDPDYKKVSKKLSLKERVLGKKRKRRQRASGSTGFEALGWA